MTNPLLTLRGIAQFPSVTDIVAKATKLVDNPKNPGFVTITSDDVEYQLLERLIQDVGDNPAGYIVRESKDHKGLLFILANSNGKFVV